MVMKTTHSVQFSDDKTLLDLGLIVSYLQNESYWANHRSRAVIEKSIENSYCIGVFQHEKQVGFARIVTDYSTVFYLADIFVLPEFQNQGIGHAIMEHIENLEGLRGIRGILTTQTAHSFYEEFGYTRDNDIVQRRIMVRA